MAIGLEGEKHLGVSALGWAAVRKSTWFGNSPKAHLLHVQQFIRAQYNKIDFAVNDGLR